MRPGRQLAVLAALFAVLYALVFFSGTSGSLHNRLKPKLGLDLVGGTQVTLIAQTQGGKAPSKDSLEQARQIIENRVNGLGVSEAQVVTEGNENIVISLAGQSNDQLKQIGSAAALRFRKVIKQAADTGGVVASPSASASASASATPSASSSATPSTKASGAGGGEAAPSSSATASATPSATPSASPSASATPSASAAPAGAVFADLTPEQQLAAVQAKVGAQAWAAASALQAVADPSTDPTLTTTLKPFTDLKPEEVAVLPVNIQYNVPEISCQQLSDRPAGSIRDPKKQAVACDTGYKQFLDVAKVLGTDVSNATSTLDQNSTRIVNLSFKGSGQQKWTDLTKEAFNNDKDPKCDQTAVDENSRCRVAVVLDNTVVSSPAIQGVITGDAQITGSFDKKSADLLASQLRYGALPVTFTQSEALTISATLGTEQLRAGLLAAGIGMLLVAIYAFFYYRLLGTVIFLSLILSGLLVFGALIVLGRQIGFTLTLAGIAGFIVSLGVAADSFVIYFERLKDEIREGRSPRSAVPRAWARARRTIISANTISLLAAVVLYIVSTGSVKGFAFALGLATVLDLVVVFLFRHPIMTMFANTKAFLSPRVSGLGRVLQHASSDDTPTTGRTKRVKEA
jgi:preprotein translocase subunit SecD